MTPDQRAALEILLDAQNALDTDTQLIPLIRFVLFGTTGTVGVEPKRTEPAPMCPECCKKWHIEYKPLPQAFSGYTRTCPICGNTF